MDDFFSLLNNQLLPHWPFLMMTTIFAVVGHVMSNSVFTRARAYTKAKGQSFWWWGRETLPLHAIAAGVLVGCFWHNPEGATPVWATAADLAYFGGAGAVSLFAWAILKSVLKKRGIDLTFPGESNPPPAALSHEVNSDRNQDS